MSVTPVNRIPVRPARRRVSALVGLGIVLALLAPAVCFGAWEIAQPGTLANVGLVFFTDPQHGVVGGYLPGQAALMWTADGGQTWQPATTDADLKGYTLAALWLSGPNHGWVGGYAPGKAGSALLLKSADGGRTWQKQPLPAGILSVGGLWFDPAGRQGWLLPDGGKVAWRTADGGATWQSVKLPVALAGDSKAWFFSFDHVVACGDQGTFLLTQDAGATWQTVSAGLEGEAGHLTAVRFAPDGKTGWAVGGEGKWLHNGGWGQAEKLVLLHTTDGGATWGRQSLPAGTSTRLDDVWAVSPTEAWVGSFGGYGLPRWAPPSLLHTTDGGQTWQNESPTVLSILALFFLDPAHGWAVGGQGGSPREGPRGVLIYHPHPIAAPVPTHGFTLAYRLRQAGTVSLSVFDEQGKLVKQVLVGEQQQAGEHQAIWDGTNTAGRPVPAGTYTWKGVCADLGADYWMTAGCSGNPPYPTDSGTGGWGGWNPSSVASDGSDWYLLFRMQEGEGALIKVDAQGQVLWKASVPGEASGYEQTGEMAVAVDDRYVYVVATTDGWDAHYMYHPREVMWRVDRATGEYVPWKGGRLTVALDQARSDDSLLYNRMVGQALVWAQIRGGDASNPYPLVGVRGVAAAGGKIYVPLYLENKIAVYDLDGERVAEIPGVDTPGGIAVAPDGTLYVASGRRIVKVAPASGAITPVVTAGLDAPWGVALGKQGNLYVTDLGTSQQIKKFSPTGKLLATIGKPGGDLTFSGPIRPDVLRFPLGLAINDQGQICVADSGLPGAWYGGGARNLVYDGQGRLLHQWLNPGTTEGNVVVWPAPDGTWQLFTGSDGEYRFHVNPRAKTWDWTGFWYPGGADWKGGVFWDPHNLAVSRGGARASLHVIQGRTYLFQPGINASIFRVEGDKLIPCVAVGSEFPADLAQGWQPDPQFWGVFSPSKPGFDPWAGATGVFLWRDRNGDGVAQADEVSFGQTPEGAGLSPDNTAYLDDSFNLYLTNTGGAQGAGRGSIYKLPCLGFDAVGTPRYDLSKLTAVVRDAMLPEDPIPGGKGKYGNYDFGLYADQEGNVFATQTTVGADQGIGWAADIHLSKLTKWNKDGVMLWRIGEKATGFAKPGQTYRLSSVSGIEKGFVFCSDVQGPERVYTTDGLYAGSLLRDLGRATAKDAYSIWCENFVHRVFTDPTTNQTWLAGGYDGVRFYKVTGLDQAQRFTGNLEITAAQAAVLTPAVAAPSAAASAARLQRPDLFFIEPVKGGKPPVIDGDLSDWNLSLPQGPICKDPTDPEQLRTQSALTYAMWDADNLYLAARVNDPTPLVNTGRLAGRWWYGDSLQPRLGMPSGMVWLGLYYDSASRRNFVVRAYGGSRSHEPVLENPPGTEIATKPFPDGTGYTVEAKLPWKQLDEHFGAVAGAIFHAGMQVNWGTADPNVGEQVGWGGAGPPTLGATAPAVLLPHPAAKVYGLLPAGKPLPVDGDLSAWPATDVAVIQAQPGEKEFSAVVRACYTPEDLYVAFDVNDPSPMRNAGGDIETAFKTGDTCEVFLSVHPGDDPARTEPTAGDYRILMTMLENKRPVVAAFRAVVPGMKPRYVWGRARLDKVEEIPGARMAVKVRPDGSGYTLTAAIPWKYFGLTPTPGLVTKADFAVNFSNAAGTANVAKVYWSGHNVMTNDLPTETMIHPDQWDWLAVEP